MSTRSGEWRAPILFYLVLGLIVVSGTTGVLRSLILYSEGRQIVLEQIGDLTVHRTFLAAREESHRRQRPLFILFTAPWSDACKAFEAAMVSSPVHAALKASVILKITDADPAFRDFSRRSDYTGVRHGLPFFVILDSEARLRFSGRNLEESEKIIRALD
ncbi:MAG: thioredoxin family protein [Leptospirales bacterium]|nr:thioredoxin family protein [Leptospirales bacterium]